MELIRIVSLSLMMTLIFTSSVLAKPFEGKTSGVGIFVGEVACYGEHEIRPEFLATFKEQLWQALKDFESKGKLHTVGDDQWLGNGNAASGFAGIIRVNTVLRDIHMDAIAYGPSFAKESANAQMIHYAERALGEDYFWDDEKIAARKKLIGKPYHISPKMTNAAKTVGEEYDADYLLFCNLVDSDIQLKNSIFNASTTLSERPKQIKVASYFYLIDTKTGLVYEGYNFSDKTGQILNLLGQYGKAMTAQNLLQCMFEVQSKRIVEDMCNAGQKVLAKGN
ncbi:MAG: hypothetical protein IJ685_02665 [Selenomonadaceae bacterium]|nr:hypothetical protein [Selenomonadaceae bacterium]